MATVYMCVCACLENNKWQYLETRYMWLDDTLWLWSSFSRLISLTHFFHREKRPWLSIHGRDTLRDTPCKKGTIRLSRESCLLVMPQYIRRADPSVLSDAFATSRRRSWRTSRRRMDGLSMASCKQKQPAVDRQTHRANERTKEME